MRRLLLLPVLLCLVSPDALAADGHAAATFSGRISGLDAATITVRDGNRSSTCFLTAASPSLASFAVGEHVKLACRKNILVGITLKGDLGTGTRAAPTSTTAVTTTGSTSGLSGTITALSAGSITVHDGDRDVTCAVDESSPPVSGYSVGSHARIGCANGVLATIVPVTTVVTTPEQQSSAAGATGTSGAITALSATSITVNVEHPVTCALGANAAVAAGYEVGDLVRIGCLNGLLYYIVGANGTSVSPLATTTTTGRGTRTGAA